MGGERGVHEGVRKAHFASVDDAIANSLDESEDIVVFRIEGNALQCLLLSNLVSAVNPARNCEGEDQKRNEHERLVEIPSLKSAETSCPYRGGIRCQALKNVF